MIMVDTYVLFVQRVIIVMVVTMSINVPPKVIHQMMDHLHVDVIVDIPHQAHQELVLYVLLKSVLVVVGLIRINIIPHVWVVKQDIVVLME
jgi:hypothetical protein